MRLQSKFTDFLWRDENRFELMIAFMQNNSLIFMC